MKNSAPTMNRVILYPGESRVGSWRIAFLTFYLLSAAVFFEVPFAFTNSGRIGIYGSDLMLLPAVVVLVFALARRRSTLPRYVGWLTILAAAFFLYCLAVIVFRFATGSPDLQSLLIPRSNLGGVLLLLILVCGVFSLREILIATFAFAVVLAILSAPLSVLDAYLPFGVFENQALRTDFQFFLTPLLLLGVLRRESLGFGRAVLWLFALCLASLLFCAVVSGARVNAAFMLGVIAVAVVMMILLGERTRRLRDIAVAVIAPVLVAAVVVAALAPFVPRIQYGLERNPVYALIASQLPAPVVAEPDSNGSEPSENATSPDEGVPSDPVRVNDEAEQSAAESTSSRVQVWAKAWDAFTQNVVFGTGLKQYPVTYTLLDQTFTSIIHPHNFVLEYLMAFGILGFALWLALVLYAPIRAFAGSRRTPRWSAVGIGLFAISLGMAWGASFFQPLMLYPTVLLVFFFIVGAFSRVFAADSKQGRERQGMGE